MQLRKKCGIIMAYSPGISWIEWSYSTKTTALAGGVLDEIILWHQQNLCLKCYCFNQIPCVTATNWLSFLTKSKVEVTCWKIHARVYTNMVAAILKCSKIHVKGSELVNL